MPKKKNSAAVEMARKRADSLTPERRREIARNAVNKRWERSRTQVKNDAA